MTEYVLGFMFNYSRTEVALIRKARPAEQAGNLNGIGGHIDRGETPEAAMVREFREEAAYQTLEHEWKLFAIKQQEMQWKVFCFCTSGQLDLLKTVTDEPICFMAITKLLTTESRMNADLIWLIPMALVRGRHGESFTAHVIYQTPDQGQES